MATLNIKNFPAALYRRLKKRAEEQRRSMAQEVTRILERALEEPEPLSILELEGLGAEVWRDGDRERESWDD